MTAGRAASYARPVVGHVTQRSRWGAGLAAIALLAAAPRAHADPPAKAATAKAQAPRYLYLTTLTADKPDAETEALFDAVDNAVLTGVRLSLSRDQGDRRYDDVLSYRRIYAEARATVAPALRELSLYATRDLGREIEAARTRIPKGSPIHLLKPVIFRSAAGELRVDLELYDPDGMKLLAVKSAGGCGEAREEVLEGLRQAAERLGRGGGDRPPIAVTGLTPSGDPSVGAPVVLDGCRSADPDHDALAFTWRQTRAPDGVQVLPGSGYPGRRLRFVPEAAGRYDFELEVRQIIGGKIDRSTRTVHVSEPPRADPGPSRVVEKAGERVILKAGGDNADRQIADYAWVQVGGPSTVMTPEVGKKAPDSTSTRCAGPRCSFVPKANGLYTFELSVAAGGATDRQRVSILVAPRPRARLRSVEVEAHAGIPVLIDGSGSSDPIDEKPTFHWEIIDPRGDAALRRGDEDTDVAFVSNALGQHRVRLKVCARRSLPGQDLSACSETVAHVHVRRPWVTFFGSLAHHWALGPDSMGASRLLSPSIGAAFQPFNGANAPWIGAFTLLIRQSLFRVSLVEDRVQGTRFGSTAVGGNTVFALGYWAWPPSTIEALPYAGFSVAPGEPSEYGVVGGGTITVQLWRRLLGTFDGGYAHVWKAGTYTGAPPRESNQLHVGLGLGFRL